VAQVAAAMWFAFRHVEILHAIFLAHVIYVTGSRGDIMKRLMKHSLRKPYKS
jgi:hypothetical protein